MNKVLNEIFLELKHRKKVKGKGDFADKLEYNRTYVSGIFNLDAEIPEKLQKSLIKVFGVSPNYIKTGSGAMFNAGTDTKEVATGDERIVLKGHSKEAHIGMINALQSKAHEGDMLSSWIKNKYQISKFGEEYLSMTYANLKHHLAKERLEPGFRRLFEEKMNLDVHRDIFGYPAGDKPDDAHIREKVRTLNINDMLIELYNEIESIKNKL